MKICAIICEFNPFHNGHKYLLEKARALSGCDAILCIMSGNFTQRGDICVMPARQRAKHAILCGADCVIELPAAFAVAPAEIFARGAIKILSAIPEVTALAFGCESGDRSEFLDAAKLLLKEDDNFKSVLNAHLASGESYVKSYAAAFESAGGNAALLSKPNSVLAIEYTKAILRANSNIDIIPVQRVGAQFDDSELKQNFSSASAIRKNICSPLVKNNVPQCVLEDLQNFSAENERYNDYLRLILSRTQPEKLKRIYGCNEGLENALKNLQNLPVDEIIEKLTCKRYSSSRIKRILCANFLELYSDDCQRFLNANLYISPLAVKKERADSVLSALAKSCYPVITCGSDIAALSDTTAECKAKDDFAALQWQQIAEKECSGKLLIV